MSSASNSQKFISLVPHGNVQGRASSSRCSAAPEGNGVWVTEEGAARPGLASGREWSSKDSWSVQKPLQMPLEDAIHRGNWLEAMGLVDKMLSIGSLQDITSIDKLIKGE